MWASVSPGQHVWQVSVRGRVGRNADEHRGVYIRDSLAGSYQFTLSFIKIKLRSFLGSHLTL